MGVPSPLDEKRVAEAKRVAKGAFSRLGDTPYLKDMSSEEMRALVYLEKVGIVERKYGWFSLDLHWCLTDAGREWVAS
jgi:hypothetical protein